MSFVLFGLSLYFAAMLGVSGLAKVENTNSFASTLRRQRILPTWSIQLVSSMFPWLEVGIALLLIVTMGALAVWSAAITLLLCACFLATEITVALTKRAADCGCYGTAYKRKVDGASIGTSTLLVLIAGLQLWLAGWTPGPGWQWRLGALLVYVSAGVWLCSRMWQRRRAKRLRFAANTSAASSDVEGEQGNVAFEFSNTH